jgi:CRISPR/Cas system Type II protein with McrA/HNH and RuvC-like nuclease domain
MPRASCRSNSCVSSGVFAEAKIMLRGEDTSARSRTARDSRRRIERRRGRVSVSTRLAGDFVQLLIARCRST